MNDSDRLTTSIDGHIGWLTVDRPESRGALTREMWEALPGKLVTLAASDGVRVLIIRGSGGHFVAGADISEFRRLRSNPQLARSYDEGANATIETLASLSVPSIAMIGGPCIGGGCLIAFACDLRIAATSARLGIPAGRLGLAYPLAALERLVEAVGEAAALDLTLTGRLVDGEEARLRGLVHYACDEGSLEAETRALAERIAANAPLSMRYVRLALRRHSRPRLDRERVEQLADACFTSEDYAEGTSAFLEKRSPRFKGR